MLQLDALAFFRVKLTVAQRYSFSMKFPSAHVTTGYGSNALPEVLLVFHSAFRAIVCVPYTVEPAQDSHLGPALTDLYTEVAALQR